MYQTYIKRILDIVVALVALPFVLLIIIIVAPFIYLEDRGPIFYNAERRGLNGKAFKMFKFRSMHVNAPDIRNEDSSTFNSENDPRVTQVGKILRKSSIDEVLQILNVLKGDMSFIGPRPNLTSKAFSSLDEIERKRITIRPGITGYNQAYYRNSIPQREKYINDCYYVDHVSLVLDMKILFKTVGTVLLNKNINTNPSGSGRVTEKQNEK
ncbi:sugar transferase [Alkalihalobacillus sp. CinArs1]|uniref:sugar transferase n=1 Tax=Alkalihalobacillus sp. CinArs1 TaxID=2995314 RepID=UPI0022DD9035|nr:sugar transferase [Alkalihalobacillus sp. CinArs1]